MITHYDMGSCEMIADPEMTVGAEPASLSLPSVQPRLQSVAEAVQLERQQKRGLPPDLSGTEVERFITRQIHL